MRVREAGPAEREAIFLRPRRALVDGLGVGEGVKQVRATPLVGPCGAGGSSEAILLDVVINIIIDIFIYCHHGTSPR